MSRMTDFTIPSTVPGRTLHAFCCEPEGEVRAVLQLSHGMVEFIDRYKPLAEYLAGQGIVVVGHDHLGHGGSIRTKADYGYFAEPDGNRAVLDDLHAMTLRTKERYPGVPYFLLGHSMGSFYARQYLCEYGQELSGAIIMGTGHQPKALVQFARSTCRALAAVHGWQYRSKLVANLSFMGYNKGLEGRACGNCTFGEAVYKSKNNENLYLMAAPFDTENELSPSVFTQLVNSVKDSFDFVLIDSPAGIGSGFETAAAPADRALIVTNAEPTGVRGAVKVRRKLESMGKTNIRLVINRFDRKLFTQLGFYEDLDSVIDATQTQLIALVPFDIRISVIVQRGVAGLNWSAAASVFDCLAQRPEGKHIPLAFKG